METEVVLASGIVADGLYPLGGVATSKESKEAPKARKALASFVL